MKKTIYLIALVVMNGVCYPSLTQQKGEKRNILETFPLPKNQEKKPRWDKISLSINQQLLDAIKQGQVSLVKELIENGAEVNTQGTLFPLTNYCLKYIQDIIETIDRGRLKRRSMRRALQCTAYYIHENVRFDIGHLTTLAPLHLAACKGKSDIVSILLNAGANINTQDDMGATPLHYALDKGHSLVVEFLIDRKAMVNVQDAFGYSPLHIAVFHNRNRSINHLLEAGADINSQGNRSGIVRDKVFEYDFVFLKTPVHLACAQFPVTAIKNLLKKHGATQVDLENGATQVGLETRDGSGATALHYAVRYGNKEAVYSLFNHYVSQKNKVLKELLMPLLCHNLIGIVLEYHGYDAVFKLLSLADARGRTPLDLANGKTSFGLSTYHLTCYLKNMKNNEETPLNPAEQQDLLTT